MVLVLGGRVSVIRTNVLLASSITEISTFLPPVKLSLVYVEIAEDIIQIGVRLIVSPPDIEFIALGLVECALLSWSLFRLVF